MEGKRSLRSGDVQMVSASGRATRSRATGGLSEVVSSTSDVQAAPQVLHRRRASARSTQETQPAQVVATTPQSVAAFDSQAGPSRVEQQVYTRRRVRSRSSFSSSPRLTLLQPLEPEPARLPVPIAEPLDGYDTVGSSPLSSPTKSSASSPVKLVLPLTSKQTPSQARKGKGRASDASLAPSSLPPRPSRPPKTAHAGSTRKQAERRVLPARIRRAAGGGAEGIRELEEMILDWLDRWGEPSDSPPDSLVLHLTTLPLSLVTPAPAANEAPVSFQMADEPVSPCPPIPQPIPSSKSAHVVVNQHDRIEVPSWIFVKAGEDDKEEARDEIQLLGVGAGRRIGTSPMKRSRHLASETHTEDISDAHYIALHKKYEVIERRQRIREKEMLQFERHKMRSRIDLLRGMSKTAWAAVLGVVLSRAGPAASDAQGDGVSAKDAWARGREKLAKEGPDWLKETLVKEGETVMRRYDQLLPPEHKRPRITDSRTPTPMISPSPAPSPSLSPPPVIPHRVALLRDATTAPRKRSASSSATPYTKISRIKLTIGSAPGPRRDAGSALRSSTDDMPTPTRGRPLRHRDPHRDSGGTGGIKGEGRSMRSKSARQSYSKDAALAVSDDRPATVPAVGERRASLRSQGPPDPQLDQPTGPLLRRSTLSPVKVNTIVNPIAPAPPRRQSRSSTRRTVGKTIEYDQPPDVAFLDTAEHHRGQQRSDPALRNEVDMDLSSDEARELHEVEVAVL